MRIIIILFFLIVSCGIKGPNYINNRDRQQREKTNQKEFHRIHNEMLKTRKRASKGIKKSNYKKKKRYI